MEYINKFLVFLKKKKQLTEVKLEHEFFRAFFREDLQGDEAEMRKELSEIRSKKQTEEETQKAIDLERKINVVSQVRQRIRNAEAVEKELEAYIKVVKSKLCFWK